MPKRRADSPSPRPNQISRANTEIQQRVAGTSTAEPKPDQHNSKRRRLETTKGTQSLKNQSSRRNLRAKLEADARMNTQVLTKSKPEPELSSGPPTPDSLPREIQSTRNMVEEELAELRRQLQEKDQQLQRQRDALNHVHQQLQCQICLETLQRPFALVPCGHVACVGCLQQWFSAPAPEEGAPAATLARRKKTCPHCRARLNQRPVEIYTLKEIISNVEPALNVQPGPQREVANPEDPWKDIFFEERHGARIGVDGALIDHADGGVRRCPSCLCEIYEGVCAECGEEFMFSSEEEEEEEEMMYNPYIFGAPPDFLGHMDLEPSDDEGSYDEDFIDDGPIYEQDGDMEDDVEDAEFLQQQLANPEPEPIVISDESDASDDSIEIQRPPRLHDHNLRHLHIQRHPQVILSDEEVEQDVEDGLSDDDQVVQYQRRPAYGQGRYIALQYDQDEPEELSDDEPQQYNHHHHHRHYHEHHHYGIQDDEFDEDEDY
ncbi:SubName: Full=Uncharacterized protein {ECO:0000313/EMBL:CCA73860.1} [Serendipita indica DSM 11827]|nr:SubName: Full=Uncharacterized protein {ECO:0000313/EMBL:CCA73860.1} [Serendipita indica DSM 11827]